LDGEKETKYRQLIMMGW